MFWFGDSDRTALWVCAREAIIAVEYNFNVELLPIIWFFDPAKAFEFQAIVCTIVVIIMTPYKIFLILISLLYIQH